MVPEKQFVDADLRATRHREETAIPTKAQGNFLQSRKPRDVSQNLHKPGRRSKAGLIIGDSMVPAGGIEPTA